MPPRASNPTTSTTAVTNGRSAPKGPRDQHRPKKEEPENEEPTGPVIRSQITNTKKASTCKSFLDAIRGGHGAKRTPAAAPPAPQAPAAAAAAAVEEPPQAPAVEEPVVVEPVVPEETTPVVEEPVVVEAPVPAPVPAPAEVEVQVEVRPHVPVTLPEADTRFSWASDEDYSFVNQYASTPQPEEPVAPSFRVQYPESVIDIQQQVENRFLFKAPADEMTIVNFRDTTAAERLKLDNDIRRFEDMRDAKEADFRRRLANIESKERSLSDRYNAFEQERLIFKQEQDRAIAQARVQAQAQAQSHYQQQQRQQQQQQQQQQQSFAPPPVSAPHSLQQQAPGYPPSQDTNSWSAPPQQDRWVDSSDVMAAAPPYDPNAGYYNFNPQFPDHRGKGPYPRYGGAINHGGVSQQPPRGRGAMRGGPGFMGPAYSRRPMVMPRGEVLESGPNHVFQPRQHM